MINYIKWIIELIVICIQLGAIQAQISTANSSITPRSRTCKAPPQPKNGHWQLHRSQCTNGENCDVPEETELEIGSVLTYSCNSGYKLNGYSYVFCSIGEMWLIIPICLEIRCKPLSTASTEARCTYNDEWVSCESPVLPGTKALLSCQNSYQRDITLFSKDEVRCNTNGEWNPQPIRCVPVCGTLPADVVPLIIDGVAPNITEFPWHASMYQEQRDKSKKYFCGATIIQESLLITAAHCVYDEVTKRLIDASKIYIVTGNVFRDYDSSLHNQDIVKKNKVKKIHIICNYIGFIGNYAWDIAILELVTPFVLSSSLVPACLSPFSDEIVLEPGVYGKVAGFGRTAMSKTSPVLQALTVPYISYSQCKSASQNPNTEQFITIDKFCAGYLNGSSVCDGDSGGGLVVKTNGLWYLRGIVSASLGTIFREGTLRCDNNLYTLYTRVFIHVGWIQDVIGTLQQNQLYPSCPIKLWCQPLITFLTTESIDARCIYNDKWVSCESPVLPGTTASLSCRSNYQRETALLSRDEVRCNASGQWEPEPIRCSSVCGKLPPQVTFIADEYSPNNTSEFPWHATLYAYARYSSSKLYLCEATIIRENLLITTAYCVNDKIIDQKFDADKIYVIAGNMFRDYDSPLHDSRLVQTNTVKNIYIPCNYLGLRGNYAWNIAILELDKPFVFSTWLVPACLDFSNDQRVLRLGDYGKVAGFGRTAHNESSSILQALNVPYVPYNQCISVDQITERQQFITFDKFCAGYLNDSSACNDGDSGGGFVVKMNDLWYLRGIVNVFSPATLCNNWYTLYTEVSSHRRWIQDVITTVEQNRSYPACPNKLCRSLSTASTEATCTYNNERVSCESLVLPGTKALLSCRNSYRRETTFLSEDKVRCSTNGQWHPQPIRCVRVCGTLPADVVPLIFGGGVSNITEFPWHASMYKGEPDKSKKYFCGATIIQENLLITAAHCVYDEVTKRLIDASKIYIVTGNVFLDYDSLFHDHRLVKKKKVKRIHIKCNYLGLTGNYASDIAILELVTPFVLSNWLVPACLDLFSDQPRLETGVYGKVTGFGRTEFGESSAVLKSLTMPRISYHDCRLASHSAGTEQFITIDKFCAGYLNGSSACDGDSGGGFVVKINGLWYLQGIISVSLGSILKDGGYRCDNNMYSIYTEVSSHMEWIKDVISTLEQNRQYPSCPNIS